MRIEFGEPLWFLLAIPLALHLFWMAGRIKMLSRARRAFALVLRSVVLSLILCALAGMKVTSLSKDLTVFFLLDNSDSVPEAQKSYAKKFIEKNLLDLGVNDRAGIILFGANAAVERGPSAEKEFEKAQSVVNAKGTNLAGALQLAMACFVGESQKRIVLVSDGNQNAGDAEDAARTVAGAKIALDVVPLKYENRNDVILEKAIVENRVNLDEPFDIKIIATAREAGPGKLTLHQDGKLIGGYDVQLEADKKNVFIVPTQVRDVGFHTFEVQLDVAGDMIPENNRAFAFTFGEGEPRVLLVDGDATPSAALPSVLLSEKIRAEVIRPTELTSSLRELQNYDEVIFNNVGAADVSETQMKMIETAVHDLGLGFIMIGGENSFGPGGYNDSAIERVLPVEMELKNEKILPQGALVPIIHTVEINEGNFWAEKIAQSALNVLSPQDLMGVLLYSWDRQETWLFPLQEVGNKVKMASMIRGMQPADMPSFDKTLQMAFDALSQCSSAVKHIVIISDGDPQTPNQALAQKIKNAKITISTVCISPHSPRDSDALRTLAEWGGGNFYQPTQYDKLPQIFIKEATTIRKSFLFEEPFKPVSRGYSPMLPGIGADYPVLKGYVGTSPKDLADLPIVTDKADPLLAHWQYGLGKTVAFTSDAKERWGANWLAWGKYAKFWSQAVRWSLRSPFNHNYQIETVVDGTEGKIIVDAVDNAGEFRNFLDLKGRVVSPSLEGQDITFRQTAPGRYEAAFKATEPGTFMFSASAKAEEGDARDLITGGTAVSYSPEFQNPRSNEALLYRLAEVTKSRVLDEKSNVFLHNLAANAEARPLWPLLLTLALPIFVFDVFTRRVLIGWTEFVAGARAVGRWLRERHGWRKLGEESSAPTNQLLKLKESARAAEGQNTREREEFLASIKQAKPPVAKPQAGRKPVWVRPEKAKPPEAGPTAPASSGTPDAAATHTSELLKARQKARKKMDKNEEGDGKS